MIMDLKLIIILVIYNKKVENSLTYKCLLKIMNEHMLNLDIFIVDNSESDQYNASFSNRNSKINYITMNGNKGLSVAYNTALEVIKRLYSKNDIVILMDDDTNITYEYFKCLISSVNIKNDIYAPIVIGQDNIIYSPNESHFLKNKLLKKRSQNPSQKKFNAISSCLAIKLKVFSNYSFDERLFLDEIDQKFCDDQRKSGKSFLKIDTTIKQNFHQRNSNINPSAYWIRFKIRIKDIFIYGCIKGRIYKILAFIKVNLLAFEFAIKLKDFSLITKTLKYSIYYFFSRRQIYGK